MKYQIITYGCQMNESDSERIAAVLEKSGYKQTSEINEADLIVVNMCSVRQSAVDRIFGLDKKIKELKTKKHKLQTILTGCFLKKDKEKFSKIFDYIVNTKDFSKLLKIRAIPSSQNSHDRGNSETMDYFKIKPKYQSSFSAEVPIMTGCNNFCAYCVVPYTRGREVSRPAKEIICEIKNLIKNGAKEVWLLGQNVNSYKTGGINFPKLLKAINAIKGNFWIRFTSPHPKDFSEKLIEIMAKNRKITPYLNLPVQAGDDSILKKMNRHYTVAQYKNLVKKIRKKIPNISLSTDIIVGFPGETKKQFNNSVKLFKKIKFDMAYINKYSPRPGTAAAKMEDNIPKKEKDRRSQILNEILKKTALENNKKYIDGIVEVLIENKKNDDWVGKTLEYKTIKIQNQPYGESVLRPAKFKNIKIGQFIKVRITDATPWGLKGKLYEK